LLALATVSYWRRTRALPLSVLAERNGHHRQASAGGQSP